MCGCTRHRNRVSKIVQASPPKDLVLVETATAAPVYGCVTGTRYPFDESGSLYVDERDAKCLAAEEFEISWA